MNQLLSLSGLRRCVHRISDVVAFRHTGRSDRRSISPSAARRLRFPATLCLDVRFLVSVEENLVEHGFLQLRTWIFMTVHFGRGALTPAPCSHALPLPLSFSQRRVAILIPVRELLIKVLFRPYSKPVHNRLDTRYTARDNNRLL